VGEQLRTKKRRLKNLWKVAKKRRRKVKVKEGKKWVQGRGGS
jgi:hypothetical protein